MCKALTYWNYTDRYEYNTGNDWVKLLRYHGRQLVYMHIIYFASANEALEYFEGK